MSQKLGGFIRGTLRTTVLVLSTTLSLGMPTLRGLRPARSHAGIYRRLMTLEEIFRRTLLFRLARSRRSSLLHLAAAARPLTTPTRHTPTARSVASAGRRSCNRRSGNRRSGTRRSPRTNCLPDGSRGRDRDRKTRYRFSHGTHCTCSGGRGRSYRRRDL